MNMHETKSALVGEVAAARTLDLKVSTLRRWRWSGFGPPFIKLGSAVRYDPVDLQEFIERGRRASTTDSS